MLDSGERQLHAPRGRAWSTRAGAIALTLLVGFFALPPLVGGGPGRGWLTTESDIVAAAGVGLVQAWTNPGAASPQLESLVDYWFGFHLLKAVVASLLLLAALAGMYTATRRAPRAAFGAVVGFAVVALMANIQGAVAPLASLLSMLPPRGSAQDVTEAAGGMHAALVTSPDGGWPEPLAAVVRDFATYHWALAVVGAVVAGGLLAVAIRSVRRRAFRPGILCSACAAVVLVIVAANVSTAMNPVPALTTFLSSWS